MSVFSKVRKKLPLIRQEQLSECGHACVLMISNYHGHQMDLAALRALEPPSLQGSSLLDITNLLDKLQLSARAIRVDPQELVHVQSPAILHWDLNHFVVLKAAHKKYVIIHDPAFGERKVTYEELSQSFTGIVLEVTPKKSFAAIQGQQKLALVDLFKGIQGFNTSLVILLFLSLAIELFVLLNPLFIQYVTDGIVSSNSMNNLYVVVSGFLILTLCHTFIEYMRSHFVVYLTNCMTEYFSSGVMHHLLKIPYSYFERRHKGDILSRFYALNEIQNKITTDFITTLLDGFVILLALVIMFVYSIKLTLIVLVALSIYIGIRVAVYRHHKKQTEVSITEHSQVNSKFLEIIQSIMTIKLYAKENAMFQGWHNHLIKALNADIQISRVNILYQIANVAVFNVEHILVIACGALLVMHNQFSVGMLMAFLAYRQSLVNKSSSFIHKIFDYQLISVQLDRVSDILVQPVEKSKGARLCKEINGDISVNRLSYRYAENQNWIFKDLSFHIKKGEKVVITGPSGVGKTTLLKIMLGLITPSEGDVWIDNMPLSTLGQTNYRKMCASVMQEDTLISGSLLDNITFMDTHIDLNKVFEVARVAHIHEDILNMPMGYETLIGDLGSTLSGGQKQRVLLARALYKNPKILFLDEATSHLDQDTEVKINAVLKKLNITQVIIAHREESIKMADRAIQLFK